MQKSKFVVEGLAGKRALSGTIAVGGAKNAVLKGLAASVLFEDEVHFENVPEIEDVQRMRELLAGVKESPVLRKEVAERLRASVVLTGPTLTRFGEVTFPYPGGCVLGERPIDLFLEGFKAMGAEVEERNDLFYLKAKSRRLRGAHIFFPFISVTATETLMLAAVLAEGETLFENSAMEPEIPHLAAFLNSCGAHIEGAGTPTVRVRGTNGALLKANGKTYQTPPDRIEAGSFIILAALAGKEVVVDKCEPGHMQALLAHLARAGVEFQVKRHSVVVKESDMPYTSVSVRTHEYPGFPTDLQAPMGVFLTQAEGETTVQETIFDGRMRYADDLIRMGADITVMSPHRMLVRGPRVLTGKDLEGPDLRAGLAYLIAATVARGTSTINNAYVIDRGYERVEERLQKLGLNIKREYIS